MDIDYKTAVLKSYENIQKAITVLNDSALRIVIVVDDNDILIGTVTDGDIRRAIINNLPMDAEIINIMYTDPIVANINDNKEKILSKMKKYDILQIPIVDNGRKLVGLEVIHHLINNNRYDNPVFLLAGGFGKRLRPLTDNVPKPLLKVGSKPILENILDQFIAAGFSKFYISTHYKAEMLREYFGDGSKWDVTINYIHEDNPLGTAGSLGLLPKNLPDLPILIMNGDILTKINFDELLSFHLEGGSDATMCVREYDFQVPYGVIETDGKHVTSINEKPVHRFFVNAGIYVLNPRILNMIDGVTYLDMTQLLEKEIELEGKVSMFPIHEYWLDIGQVEQFEQAVRDSKDLF